jgi:predicted amidohydrolase
MNITIAQLHVGENPTLNKTRMLEILNAARPREWVVFPEGMLSGYAPEQIDFTQHLDAAMLEKSIGEIQSMVIRQQCYCVFGTVTFKGGCWYNSVLSLGPSEKKYTHHKIQLSALDRKHFTPGLNTAAHEIGGVRIGIQACRELLFPHAWGALKNEGAQIIFHINNAVQPKDSIWEHILITRAVELGVFVCSVNNGAPPQSLASYLIAPSGRMILRTMCQQDQILTADIDPDEAIVDLAKRTDF